MSMPTPRNWWRAACTAALCAFVACGSDRESGPAAEQSAAADTEPASQRPQPKVKLPDESGFTPSSADGGGRVTVEPTQVGVREPVTLTFTYEAGPEGIAPGGGVVFHVSKFWGWTPPQVRRPDRPGYTTITCSNPAVRLGLEEGQNSVLLIRVEEEAALVEGDRLVIRFGDTSGGQHPRARGASDRFAEHGERFYFKVDGDGDTFATPIAEQPRFDVLATHPKSLKVIGPSRATAGEPFELSIAALDAMRNRVESWQGKVALVAQEYPNWPETQIEIGEGSRGARRAAITLEEAGPWLFVAHDAEGELEAGVSNPILIVPPGEERYQLYWGDLQIHGNLSDGTGAPEDLYAYARDVARLDVAAVTEHDHWGYEPLKGPSNNWAKVQSATETFHEPGRFVTFPAYVYTNWTTGHRHVIFESEAEADVFSWSEASSRTPEQLWELLAGRRVITIPHHPGGGPVPIYWPVHDPGFEPVVEIASIHGVSERLDHPAVIHQPVASGMVVEALKLGHRLGFLGSGDTHDGHPGLGNPAQPPPGLAGIWAEELTREAVFEAIEARRVYATFGSRSILRFFSGDVPMGSVLPGGDGPVTYECLAFADAPIRVVSFVENGEIVHEVPGGGLFASESWTDENSEPGDSCYVRLELESDGWVWSSPIWVE